MSGSVRRGLQRPIENSPDTYEAEIVTDWIERIPASHAANGINGQYLPAPVPEYRIKPFAAAVFPIGSVAGVVLPAVPALFV